MSWRPYLTALGLCLLLFLVVPIGGVIMAVLVLGSMAEAFFTRPSYKDQLVVGYTTPADWKKCKNFNPDGPTPCWHPHCDCMMPINFEYACRCHRVLGNDFYFLPKNSCLYGKCDV